MKDEISIKDVNGNVIFSFNKRYNTIKDTLEEAVRSGVSLRNANLRYRDLRGAFLESANLDNSDLSGADLSCVNLSFSYMQGADLSGANLKGANLRHTKLYDADFKGAYIGGADIYGANLIDAKKLPDLPLACPSEGEFIGWKKITYYKEKYYGIFLVKLLIPEDAKRSSATTDKCRCDKAKVVEITNIATGKHVGVITNINRAGCVYKVGEMVYPDRFDDNRWNECSHGIHFFMNREDAVVY